MYARTGKLTAQPGQRDAFIAILLEAAAVVGESPDCHLYLVTEDLNNDDDIWVLELWTDKAAHGASLKDERVRALIGRGMPLMAGTPEGVELRVAGGHGAGS